MSKSLVNCVTVMYPNIHVVRFHKGRVSEKIFKGIMANLFQIG